MLGQLTDDDKNYLRGLKGNVKDVTINTWLETWYRNLGCNRAVPNRRSLGEFEIPESRQKDTIVIVAPGASLELYEQKLDKLADNAIVLVMPTAVDYCLKHRLHIDAVVLVDAGDHNPKFINKLDPDVPVLAGTYVHPDVAKEHNTYFYTVTQEKGKRRPDNDPDNELWWINATTTAIDDDIHYAFPSLGCVTNMAVNIAQDLRMRSVFESKRIVLIGADHCYYEGKGRVPRDGSFYDEIPWATENVFYWDGKLTNFKMVYYTHALYTLWASQTVPLFSVNHGILTDLPDVTIDQVLKNEFPKYPNRNWVENVVSNFFKHFVDQLRVCDSEEAMVTKESFEDSGKVWNLDE